jgi:hypothetical protein
LPILFFIFLILIFNIFLNKKYHIKKNKRVNLREKREQPAENWNSADTDSLGPVPLSKSPFLVRMDPLKTHLCLFLGFKVIYVRIIKLLN